MTHSLGSFETGLKVTSLDCPSSYGWSKIGAPNGTLGGNGQNLRSHSWWSICCLTHAQIETATLGKKSWRSVQGTPAGPQGTFALAITPNPSAHSSCGFGLMRQEHAAGPSWLLRDGSKVGKGKHQTSRQFDVSLTGFGVALNNRSANWVGWSSVFLWTFGEEACSRRIFA